MASSESDEPATTGTLPSPPSFRFENNASTQSLLSGGGSGYESQYGSLFGSRFSLTDGSGIFVSSLALTIIISAAAIVGIVLVTVIITLAVMLSSCEQHSALTVANPQAVGYCQSFQLNAELNNLEGWTVPSQCQSHVSAYLHKGQYLKDVEAAVESARRYLKSLALNSAEKYTVVMDIDETAISNLLSIKNQRFESSINQIPMASICEAVPMASVLKLYHELHAANWSIVFISERPETARNETAWRLVTAGYKDWAALILRSNDEAGLSAQAFKSSKRVSLKNQGYQIKSVIGDQWSDIIGPATGLRTFKLPNPVYQIL